MNCLLAEYDDLFQGVGKLKDFQVKLHLNKSITPVSQPHRRVLIHIRKCIETEITQLEQLDIIENVDGPMPWMSPIVAMPKPKDPDAVRICLDICLTNKAIEREKHSYS